MHFLSQYYLDFDNLFSFCLGHSKRSNGVAQISNKSKRNRRISEKRQVLDAQLCAPTNSIPIDLIQFFFFPFIRYTVFFNFVMLLFENKQ